MQPFVSQTLPLVSSMTTTVMVYVVLQDVLVNLYISVAVVSMVQGSYSVCAELESGDLQRP